MPAATPYDVWNAGADEADLVCEVRHALAFQQRLEALFPATTERSSNMRRRRSIGGIVAAVAAAIGLAAPAAADASTIVFIKNHNVWVSTPDGKRQVAVTRDGTALDPYYSPSQGDNGMIVALRGADGRPLVATFRGGGSRLYRLTASGRLLGRPRVSLFKPLPTLVPRAIAGEVSPNGRTVALTQVLYEPVAAAGQPRQLRAIPTQTIVYQDTASGRYKGKSELVLQRLWSPSWIDNTRLLVFDQYAQAGAHIFRASIGRKPTPLYRDPARSELVPGWNAFSLGGGELTRRGDKLAAVRAKIGATQGTIEIFAARGATAAPAPRCSLATRRVGLEPSLTWSPDGKSLAWFDGAGVWTSPVDLAAPTCGFAPRLIIRGGVAPDWGPASLGR